MNYVHTASLALLLGISVSSNPAQAQKYDASHQEGRYKTIQCGQLGERDSYEGKFVLSYASSKSVPMRLKVRVATFEDSADGFHPAVHRYVFSPFGCGETVYMFDISGSAEAKIRAGQRLIPADYSGISGTYIRVFGASIDECLGAEREKSASVALQDISWFVNFWDEDVDKTKARKFFEGTLKHEGLEAVCVGFYDRLEAAKVELRKVVGKVEEKKGKVAEEIKKGAKEAEEKVKEKGGGIIKRVGEAWEKYKPW